MSKINIGKQFSPDPSGRFYTDGLASGEKFREEYLKIALDDLKGDEKLEIILDDGVDGYGSSFLSEGFAGLVKYGYIESQELLRKLKFSYNDPDFKFFEDRIKEYISESIYNSHQYKSTK